MEGGGRVYVHLLLLQGEVGRDRGRGSGSTCTCRPCINRKSAAIIKPSAHLWAAAIVARVVFKCLRGGLAGD